MPGATRHARPWERDGPETTNQLELATEWRCGLPAAPRGATRMLATRSPSGQWRRWRGHDRPIRPGAPDLDLRDAGIGFDDSMFPNETGLAGFAFGNIMLLNMRKHSY